MERRQTIQKDLVLQAVLSSCGHPDAEEVYQMIAAKHPNVSRSTVYRNLHNLVDENKIRLVKVLDGAEHFDRTLEWHYHIQCTMCNRVADITLEEHEKESIVDASGYEVQGKEVVYRGLCPDCQKKMQEALKE